MIVNTMNNRHYVGWLSPNGEHLPCESYGHNELTRRIIKEYYKSDKYMMPLESEDYLFDRGWCRISIAGMLGHGYNLQMKWRYATERQKEFIREMVSDVGSFLTETTKENLERYDMDEWMI